MKKIGIIGLGELGTTLALRYLNSYKVLVYNRTLSKAESLKEKGVTSASLVDLVNQSDLVLVALFDAKAIKEVISPVLNVSRGKIFVCMTSTTSEEAKELNAEFTAAGAHFFDCAVLSGAAEVGAGQAHTLISGNPGVFSLIQPDLVVFSNNLRYLDEVAGHASSIEAASVQMLYFQVCSYVLALAIAEKDMIPVQAIVDTLQQSPLVNAPLFPLYAASMGARFYDNPVIWKIGNMARSAKMIEAHLSSIGVGQKMFAPISEMLESLNSNSEVRDKNFTAIYEAVRSK